jgi:DNA-binding CsgD family transcriptional regulator/sugar-specific transcriptional regulator TrmB
MLDALGLSARDEAVYRAMLDYPGLDLAGIAQNLGVNEDHVRAALDVLVDLALVRVSPTTQVVRAVRPQAGLAALLAKAEAEITARQRQIETTRALIAGMADDYDSDRRDEPRRLEGLETVRDRLSELAHSAREECVSFSTGGAQAPSTIAAERPLNLLALERGVQIRNIYLDSFRNDPATLAYAQWMARNGGRSRTVATLPMRLVIIDRQTALVPLDPHDASAGALELTSLGVVEGLYALFEQVWQTATPIGDVAVRDDHGLSMQERDLLRLFAAGHTDDSAARKLAISVRSVQRIMTNLNERLDAASRFQAGVEASRRGWI